mmetsp:Transcript_80394/g.222395  ORF Transcript_80394/g.222395 Transcript_80394/m.222395 type:complete len:309 (-) Transcript_80394:41-967(-)
MAGEGAVVGTPPRRPASPTSCAAALDEELAELPEVVEPGNGCFCVVTWNVWFDRRARFRRWSAVLREALAMAPHVLCLQEVTPELAELIDASAWLSQRFHTSALQNSYDVLTLVRKDLAVRWWVVPIPTTLGRRCLVADVSAAIDPPKCLGEPSHLAGVVRVANVHLESMKEHADMRARQLEAIFPAINPRAAPDTDDVHLAVLCGDFNFCSSWDENEQVLQSGFEDAWAYLREHEPGFTEDTARNAMLLEAKGKTKQVRFDRVLLRTSEAMPVGKGAAELIELLGTEPLAEDLWPSDHFGLFARISV